MPVLISNDSKVPQKTSIDEDANSKSGEILWSPFFGDFRMFRRKYSGFLNKKNTFSRKIQVASPD